MPNCRNSIYSAAMMIRRPITRPAPRPAPGIRNNFVALLLNDSPDVPQRNDIRVVRNIGVARAAADAGAQNARGAAEFLSILFWQFTQVIPPMRSRAVLTRIPYGILLSLYLTVQEYAINL